MPTVTKPKPKKEIKKQTNVMLTAQGRAILKTLTTTLYPFKVSEANVIESLLKEEAQRRKIDINTLPAN